MFGQNIEDRKRFSLNKTKIKKLKYLLIRGDSNCSKIELFKMHATVATILVLTLYISCAQSICYSKVLIHKQQEILLKQETANKQESTPKTTTTTTMTTNSSNKNENCNVDNSDSDSNSDNNSDSDSYSNSNSNSKSNPNSQAEQALLAELATSFNLNVSLSLQQMAATATATNPKNIPTTTHLQPESANQTDSFGRKTGLIEGISSSDPAVKAALGPELTLNDLNSFRLEYNKFKILSHLKIQSDPGMIKSTIDDDLRTKLVTPAIINDSRSITSGSRRKRSLSCDQVRSDKDACCLENFYVNFTHIGWDKWILYPAGYNANYCRGQCDLSHARYYHSTLLSKYNNVISLCCSPKQMAPLRLLYIDESNKVHEKSIPEMVVESCDCA